MRTEFMCARIPLRWNILRWNIPALDSPIVRPKNGTADRRSVAELMTAGKSTSSTSLIPKNLLPEIVHRVPNLGETLDPPLHRDFDAFVAEATPL